MTGDAAATPVRAAVIGAGSIGVAFAIVFARAGWQVRLHDPDESRRRLALKELRDRIDALAGYGLVSEPAEDLVERVEVEASLATAVRDAQLVQECAPESVQLKRELFAQLDASSPADAVLASSSSALTASSFADGLAGRERCLVAHPGNPPYLLRVIELVPAPFTAAGVVDRAERLYSTAGLFPVRVAREVEGFVFNRLQGALLREAYCLVRDGVATVADIDKVMTEGLGPRWSIIGPFETVDLNTRGGIASHAQKMGPAYERMGAERGQHDPWTPELVAAVTAARRGQLPLERWDERVVWRDRMLMALVRHRQSSAEAWPPGAAGPVAR
jgi:3-hydroxyacyl-CoA dehydrogenase